MLFVCQNSLLASLSSCGSSRKSAKMLKVAFGERQSNTLGKDFENFLKKTLKMISKHKKVCCFASLISPFVVFDYRETLEYAIEMFSRRKSTIFLFLRQISSHSTKNSIVYSFYKPTTCFCLKEGRGGWSSRQEYSKV